MIKKLKSKKGFTLIEIVIVLAIAALIMVIVFFAVAGAQRTRRDQQRKDLAARTVSQLENYASNNSGLFPDTVKFPATSGTQMFWGSYMQNTQPDPSGGVTYPAGLNANSGDPASAPNNGDSCGSTAGDWGKINYTVSTNQRTKEVLICLEVNQWYGPEK